MPFKKYREHLIYKRLEKKVSTPPPSTSISLQSVPLATESTRINEERILHQNKESPASSARSSPQTVGPRTLGSFFSTGSSGSNRRPLSSFLINDHHNDEYNAYSYGLVPLSERNIYREFSVIELPNNNSSEKINNSNNNTMMNTWSKKSTSTSTDYLHHHHLKVPNGSSNTLPTSHSALKSSPPSTSSLHSSNKGSSLEREKKTVRIVVEGENEGDNGRKSSPETPSKNGQGSSPKPHFRSSLGKKWNGGSGSSRGEVLIPIRREVSNGSGIRSSSISSTGSSGGKQLPSKSENHSSLMAMEPVPTPVRSYKCTSYTLNEIRSF